MSSNTKHTPGPWYVDDEMPPNGFGVFARVGDIPISSPHETPISPDRSRANAHLIAAAPNLLAACQMILSGCREWGVVRAAIRKAEGGE